MMNKEQKKNYISEMTSQFENSKAVMITHYQGLTMPQLDELRSKMREHGIIFKITKNIVDIANIHSEGRVISFLEGGYDLQALSESIIEHLNALKSHI